MVPSDPPPAAPPEPLQVPNHCTCAVRVKASSAPAPAELWSYMCEHDDCASSALLASYAVAALALGHHVHGLPSPASHNTSPGVAVMVMVDPSGAVAGTVTATGLTHMNVRRL